MKQKDIALVILIVAISAIASYFISSKIIVTPKDRQQEVEVVQEIKTKFPLPDKKYFNENAINPTRPITIGENANPDPFSDKQ